MSPSLASHGVCVGSRVGRGAASPTNWAGKGGGARCGLGPPYKDSRPPSPGRAAGASCERHQ